MAPIAEQPRVALRRGVLIVSPATGQAAERHGSPFAPFLTVKAVERPRLFDSVEIREGEVLIDGEPFPWYIAEPGPLIVQTRDGWTALRVDILVPNGASVVDHRV